MALIDEIKLILRDTLVLDDDVKQFDASSPLLGAVKELDSVGVVSVLTALEENYDIALEDDEISAEVFSTLGTLTEFVRQKIG
jgi:acyl carrier protein